MRLVRIGAICAMRDVVRHDDGKHLLIVKVVLTDTQLRLGIQARATTDLDMIFRGSADHGSSVIQFRPTSTGLPLNRLSKRSLHGQRPRPRLDGPYRALSQPSPSVIVTTPADSSEAPEDVGLVVPSHLRELRSDGTVVLGRWWGRRGSHG